MGSVLGLIIMGLGVVALVVAISFSAVARSGRKLNGQTTGRIEDISYYPEGFNKNHGVENKTSSFYSDNLHQHVAALVFTYYVDGAVYRRATNYMINDCAAREKIGESCVVRYDTANPEKATIAKNRTYGTVARVMYVIAVFLLVVGFWCCHQFSFVDFL